MKDSNRKTDITVLLHLADKVVTVLKFVDEPLTLVFEKETIDTTGSLSGQELHPCVGVVEINESSRVSLDLLEVNTICTNGGHSELLSVTSAVVAVGDWETPKLRPVLLEQRVLTLSEVYSETDSRGDDWTKSSIALTVKVYLTPTPASPSSSWMSFVTRTFP